MRRSILGINCGAEKTKSSSTAPGVVAPVVFPEERRLCAPLALENIESASFKKPPLEAFASSETLRTELWRTCAIEDV